MAEPTSTSVLDILTNLPKELEKSTSIVPEPKTEIPQSIKESPVLSSFFKDLNVTPTVEKGGYGTNPLTTATKTVDLTNTYTDPLSSYLEYNVPMNPYFNFNDVRAQNQSTAEKWMRGLTKAGVTAFGAVVENSIGALAGIGELASGGSFYDNAVGRNVDKMNNFMQEYMPNYYTEAEQNMGLMESLGTANFWADKVANGVGYSLGSIATMMLGVGEVGLLAQTAKYGVRGIGALTVKAVKLGDKLEDGFKLSNMYKAGKIVETGQKADRALALAAKFARIEKASQRLAVATNMSLAESSVEAREAQKTFIESQIAKWEAENPGAEMPTDVEEGINESARAVGNLTFAINLPITSLTNIAMFGNMMKGSAVGKGAINELSEKEAKDGVIRTFTEAGSESANKYIKAFTKASKAFKPVAGNMLEEGIQEGSQFAASELSKNYYGDKFDDGTGDMTKALSKSLSDTFGTKEGLENILIGAIVGGGTGAVQSLAGAEKKLKEAKDANTAKALEILNSGGLATPLANLEDAAIFTAAVNSMNAAAASGDNAQADLERKKLISTVAMRLDRVGGLEYGLEQLEDAKAMPEEEFKKAFGYSADKTLAEQTGGMSISEVVDDVKSSIEKTIKRKNDIKDLVGKYTPNEGFVSRMLASMGETEDSKYRKALADQIEQKYLHEFNRAAVDLDFLDEQIDSSIEDLFNSMNPLGAPGSLDGVISKQDFAAKVKNGTVTVDDDGNIQVNAMALAQQSDKTLEKLNRITETFRSLGHAVDEQKVLKKLLQTKQLLAKRAGAVDAVNNLMTSPESRDLFLEAQMVKEQAEAKKKINNTAQAVIQNAETSDEISENFPDGASLELQAAASQKIAELEAQEEQALKDFSGMTLEELEKINEEEQSPINLKALLAAKQQKLEKLAFESANNLGQVQEIGAPVNAPNMFQAEEEVLEMLSEIERATIGEIRVSAANGSIGSVFTIQGREYINTFEDKTEAIVRDADGNIVGVKLLDKVTGNFVTWNVRDEAVEPTEQTEKETAIVDAIAYAILLNEASVRSDKTITPAQAKEANDARIEAITEDFNKVQKVEDAPTTETPGRDPIANLNKTKEMSDAELRMQIETLKQDLIEIDETLDSLAQLSREAGFTKKEFNQDGQVIELKKFKKAFSRYLAAKIKELQSRKANNKQAQEENAVLQEDENATLKNVINAEIEDLKNKLKELEQLKAAYEDIVNGVYGENQNTDEAQQEIKNINRKIGATKAQITKRLNKLDALTPTQDETAEIERRIEDSNSPEGSTSTPEGEIVEDTSLDPGTPSEEVGMDEGIVLTQAEELELLRQQAQDDLANLALYGTEEPAAETPTEEPAVVVEEVGLADARLIKGQFETDNNFNVIVDADGNPVSNVIKDPVTGAFIPLNIKVDGEVISVNPQLLSDPEIAKAGSKVKFKVLDNSEYWKNTKDSIAPEDHWKTVPIMVYVEVNGVDMPITLLQSYTESNNEGEKGASRKNIFDLHAKGLTPMATVSEKRFQLGAKGNIVNTITRDGQRFFSPISTLGNDVQFAVVGKLGFKYNGTDSEIGSYLQDKSTAGFINGQVVAVITDPNGNKQLLALSTKDMTEAGLTAATNAILEANANKFKTIVGTSTDSEVDESTDLTDPNLLIVDVLPTGEAFFKFYSEEAKMMVKVDLQNLMRALADQPYKFSFVTPTFEDGNVKYETVRRPDADYALVDVKQKFNDAVKTKKYQVDVNQPINQPYTSPINGQTYPSYIAYLSSNENFTGEPVSQGTNSILKTDSFGDPFFDIGLKFEDLGVQEEVDIKTKEEIATNNVVVPTAKVTTQPTPATLPPGTLTSKDGIFKFNISNLTPEQRQLVDDMIQELKDLNPEANIISKVENDFIIVGPSDKLAATPVSDIERRRQEDRNRPSRESVMYKLTNKIAGINNPTPGNEIPTLSEAIKIAGAKITTPIKINEGEITHIVFDQEESTFRFTYKGKKFAAFYIESARGITRWEIAKFNDKTGTYRSIGLDELKNINDKYGSQKDLLISLGAKNLVEDIENFEKVKYSEKDKSSGNGIIPLENTVSAEQIRLGKKYGVTYTLEDFLKQYDADLAALEGKQTQPAPVKVQPEISLSGLVDGWTAKSYYAFDPRKGNIMTFAMTRKSFAEVIDRDGKKYVVVGLALEGNKRAYGAGSGRDRFSFASAELNETTPDNIVEILENAARDNFKELYKDFDSKEETIKPITEVNLELKSLQNKSTQQPTPTVSQPAVKVIPKEAFDIAPEVLAQINAEFGLITEVPSLATEPTVEELNKELVGNVTDLSELLGTVPDVTPSPATSTYVNAGKGENSIEVKTSSSKFARKNRGTNSVDPNQANTEGSNTEC